MPILPGFVMLSTNIKWCKALVVLDMQGTKTLIVYQKPATMAVAFPGTYMQGCVAITIFLSWVTPLKKSATNQKINLYNNFRNSFNI